MFFHLLPFRCESQETGVEFAECQGTWFYGPPQAWPNVQVSIYITDLRNVRPWKDQLVQNFRGLSFIRLTRL